MQAAKRLAGQIDMWMTDDQFREIAQLVESKTGILLPASKKPLVTARMQNIVRRSGMHTFQDWFKRYMRIPNARTVSAIVDAMTTNHTYFWREAEHFERLRDEVLPAIVAKRKRRKDIRIWCGAASRAVRARDGRSRSVRHEHRHRHVLQQMFGGATEHDLAQTGMPVGTHDDQIRILVPGCFQDCACRATVRKDGFHVDDPLLSRGRLGVI